MVVFLGQSGSIRAKLVVLIWQKWLHYGQSGSNRDTSGCIQAEVVVFGQKLVGIGAKVVVFG